jgi:hypothetical protein
MAKQKFDISNELTFNDYKIVVDKVGGTVSLNKTTVNSSDIGAVIAMLQAAKKSFPKKQ